MSRINMRTGITAEQVNEAYEAKTKYEELVNAKRADFDVNSLGVAIDNLNNSARILEDVLGADHMATRRASDASIRVQEAIEKINEKADKTENRIARALAKLQMYNCWYVIVGDKKIPVTDVTTVNGQIIVNDETYPFIPVYMPNVGIPSLFDQD